MRRALAIVGAVGLLALSGAAPVAAGSTGADGDVDVVNTETVQVYMSADGEIETRRVYEQLVLAGEGTVEVRNPVEPDGLRNLDGFGGFDVDKGVQVSEVDVDGVTRTRTVSDYDGDLPLDVEVTYRLDGEEVEPGDVVGRSGRLEVDFEVENVTGQEQEVSIPDGRGGTTTTTAEVPIPMVGSLTTTAPEGFTNVTSEEANMAGDGRGGTKLSFTMTLFPPIGSTTATFGYAADIEDGVVPRVDITALPVNPLQSPSFKSAASSYEGGASTGEELAAGATEIDGHLLEMRDGAAELLAGLIQLHEGSQELQAGLEGKAAPGAEKLAGGASDLNDGLGQIDDGASELADGAGRLRDGLGQIDDGAGVLADGAGRLSGGTGNALSGSVRLRDGLALISGGLEQLSASEGLPKAAQGVDLLKAGVDQILAGFGTVGVEGTLIDGLNRLELGATQLSGGAAGLDTGAGDLKAGLEQLTATGALPAAKGGVDQVKSGLDASLADGGSLDLLEGGLNTLMSLDCGPICQGVISTQILPGVQDSRTRLAEASQGLGQVAGGLAAAIHGLDTMLIPGAGQLAQGATQLSAGAGQLAAGATKAKNGALSLQGGVSQVRAGLVELDEGLTKAVAGVLQLSSGASDAHAGSGDLASGLGLIDSGAGELAAGAGRLAGGTSDARSGAGDLAAGAGRLADGTSRAFEGSSLLSDGAAELARGLIDAAEGSGLLAEGLGKASGGAPRLVDGAGRLSKEGTKVIAGKGAETAQEYGTLAAVLTAGAQRAEAERMAYGAPEGARGLTAYTYVLKGEDGEGGRNVARGVAAVGLLGAGLGAAAWRRRLL